MKETTRAFIVKVSATGQEPRWRVVVATAKPNEWATAPGMVKDGYATELEAQAANTTGGAA